MQTQLLNITPDTLAQAGALIRSGALVAFPTETVDRKSTRLNSSHSV